MEESRAENRTQIPQTQLDRNKIRLAYQALDSKKADRITMIDIRGISVIADCFIIADGDSVPQVRAMADAVEEALGRAGYEMRSSTGYQSASWILLDFNDVVVHVFLKKEREFYNLERLWADGRRISPDEIVNAAEAQSEKDNG
ncbi:MAG: ribosome silencing factor [Lachnospiraceae bacterium]|jgi:ribosome-associated protein